MTAGARLWTPRLETERLTLRPLASDDEQAMLAIMRDPRVMRYIGDGSPRDLTRVRTTIERSDRLRAQRRGCVFALTLRTTRELIGDGLVIPTPRTGVDYDAPPRSDDIWELGYRLAHDHWNRGYATEAAHALLAWAASPEGLDLTRVIGVTHPDHPTSGRVLTKVGMTYRGLTDDYYDTTCSLYEWRADNRCH